MGTESLNDEIQEDYNPLIGIQNLSEYKGVLSDSEGEERCFEVEAEEEEEEEDYQIPCVHNSDKVSTTFIWDKEGSIVYVTGSFCNWDNFFFMKKDENNNFSLTLLLPRKFHQYKFKVDGEWKYNDNFPIYEENGYINNCVDTTYYEINENKEKEVRETCSLISSKTRNTTFSTKDYSRISKKSNSKRKSIVKSIGFLLAQIKYSTYFPKRSEFKELVQKTPELYSLKNERNLENYKSSMEEPDIKKKIRRNSKDKKYPNKEIKKNEKILSHEIFNHLTHKKEKSQETSTYSITTRYRKKFTTFLYYK